MLNIRPRNFVSLIVTVLCLIATLALPIAGWSKDTSCNLAILYFNDPHAHYLPHGKDARGGFGKLRTQISRERVQARNEGKETLLLLAGDLLMGTPFSTAFKGELGVKLLNIMQLTAMVVGNHEFDYGQKNLLSRLRPMMTFPLLGANVRTSTGEDVFERSTKIRVGENGPTVIVVGLTTVETPTETSPNNVKGFNFLDVVETCKELLADVGETDIVIALTHLGVNEDKRLAEGCPKIDIIIGGHSHTALFEPILVNNTVICQAGYYAEYLGKLDIELINGQVAKHAGKLIFMGPAIEEDPEVSSLIDEYKSRMDGSLDEVIGRTDVAMDGSPCVVRSGGASILGRFIAYNMAVSSGADAGIINGGAIRSGFDVGDITLGEVYSVLPLSDSVVKMDLTGADIAEIMQRSFTLEDGSGGKLQSFGIDYILEEGQIKIVNIGGRGFDPQVTYSLAANNFLAAGGNGYSILKERGRNMYDSASSVSDLLINFIKNAREINSATLDSLK